MPLTAGNYLLSQTASNCGAMPEAKDGFFTTYYAFNRIVLDVLMERFDIQVDDDTVTQLMLLYSDIPGYDLPDIDFVSPLEEAQESHILKEEDSTICTHLEKMLVHMIDKQDAQIFKFHNDYVQNKRKFLQYLKYTETWQFASVIYSYAAFLSDILLIVMFVAFFLKYCKTMQAILAVFITMSTSGIPPTKANPISSMFPPLFTINLQEDQIVKDLEDIEGMQITIHCICDCSYYNIISDLQKMPFPILFDLSILRGTLRTDLFMEVNNLKKGNTIWAHYTSTGYYPTSIRLSQQILKENVCINTSLCCFKMMHIDWDNTVVTGISGIKIDMPTKAKVSIFTDNYLTHINDDHFEINLVAHLLNQIYVIPVPPPQHDYYDDPHANVTDELIPSTSTGATALAPLFLFTA